MTSFVRWTPSALTTDTPATDERRIDFQIGIFYGFFVISVPFRLDVTILNVEVD